MSVYSQLLKIKVHQLFLIMAAIFGTLFAFILPPFQAPDEQVHFYKAYAISKGQLLCSNAESSYAGSYLPSNISDFVNSTDMTNTTRSIGTLDNASQYYPSDNNVFFEHYSSCVYNALPYLPQALGIFIGDIMNLNYIWIFYLGRLLNLLVYLLICFYSIKLIPRLKKVVFLLALMPMSLHQAASLSADGLTNALSLLLICYVLNVVYKKEEYLNRKTLITIAALSILVSLLKITYFPLSLVVFLIPISKYKKIKNYFIINCSIVVLSMVSAVSWLLITRTMDIYVPVNTEIQLNSLIDDPLGYSSLLFKNIFNYDNLYLQFIGILGWLSVPLPMIVYILYFLSFFVVIAIEGSKESESITKGRVFSIIISLSIFVIGYILVETSLYLNWPQTSAVIVEGVQGRYFIPLVLLLFYGLFLLVPTCIKHSKLIICIFVAFTLLITSTKIISHYYFFGPRYQLLEPHNNHFIVDGILEDTELSQSFEADEDNLRGVSLYISTFQKQITTPYMFVLKKENDLSVIREVQLDVSKISDNSYYDIMFEPIENSKGQKYSISLFPLEENISTPITLQLSKANVYTDGELNIKGIPYTEDIVFKLHY